MTRTTPTLPPFSFKGLMRSLQTAGEVCIYESFSDAAYNASRYDEHVAADLVRVLPEDRGDGIARVRIEPTVKGRDARDSRDWWAKEAR